MNSHLNTSGTVQRACPPVLAMGALLFLVASADAASVLPPKYLSVPDFQACLSKQSEGTYEAICLPTQRPAVCPRKSWHTLRRLIGDQRVPRCR
jgi:hypothetical protein